jgi:hypothetical protein
MATNSKRTGYSDALGGYGVPSQVKITGEASVPGKSAKSAKPHKSKGLVFRPKPLNIIIIIAIAVAVVVAILFATGALGAGQYASSLDHIESDLQPVNGADATVYRPVIAEDVDWNNLDEKKRDGIAKYSVNETLKQIGSEQAGIFNILGQTYDGQPAFYYSPNVDTIQIFVNGAVAYVIPAE